jgi:hypothetical protein
MEENSGVMAAIAAAIDMFEAEEAQATAVKPRPQVTSNWKYRGIDEMMRMRTMWQLRMCTRASIKRR